MDFPLFLSPICEAQYLWFPDKQQCLHKYLRCSFQFPTAVISMNILAIKGKKSKLSSMVGVNFGVV